MRWQVSLAAALLSAGSVSADFSDGLEAYDAGRYSDALAAWQAMADQGHLDAMVAIAGLYEAGAGVAQDYRLAARWYRRAADCGHAVAQLNLGHLLSRGQGVDRDLVSADVYLSMAAAQRNAWAKDRLAEVRATMSADQKAAAAARLSDAPPRCEAMPAKAAGDGS